MSTLLTITLDNEEFVMALLPKWERSFSTRFEQNDFAHVATVGDIVWAVERRLAASQVVDENLTCSSQRVFYQLRRVLRDLGFAPDQLTPTTPLSTLLPLKDRRRVWQHLQTTLPLPALTTSGRLFMGAWLLAMLGLVGLGTAWGLAIVGGLGFAVVVAHWPFMQLSLPATTLGDLATKYVAAHYYHLNLGRVNPREVCKILLADLADCGDIHSAALSAATQLKW